MTQQEKDKVFLKAAINRGLDKFDSYWEYREDKQAEIVESIFSSIEKAFIK